MVRSHLEYANSVWYPRRISDIEKLGKVQKKATKLIHGLKRLNYVERLKILKLPTLKYRQIRGDMIQVFKIVHGIYDSSCTINLTFSESLPFSLTTRGQCSRKRVQQLKKRKKSCFFGF